MDQSMNPLEEIQKNLSRIDSRIEFLKKENDLFDHVSTELRKITSNTTNDLYSISNDLLYNKKSNNNTLINKLTEEKSSKEQSIAKLASLFEHLSSINDSAQDQDEEGLPIMDIREELDEDGNVISLTVKPQTYEQSLDISAKETTLEKTLDIPTKQLNKEKTEETHPLFNNTNEEGLPFMDIKEEVDEYGNSIRGTVLPQVGGDGIESIHLNGDNIDNSQILELFEDMGITEKKQAPKQKEKDEQPKGLTEFEKNLKNKLMKKTTPKEEEIPESVKSQETLESTLVPLTPSIPEDEILQLELIADEIVEEDEEDLTHVFEDDGEWEFEEEEEEEEDDDNDFEPVQNEVNSLLMDRIKSLRAQKSQSSEYSQSQQSTLESKSQTIEKEIKSSLSSGTQKSILRSNKSSKVKKSVTFNSHNLEQVKVIENVGEELKNINIDNLKKSLFKQSRVFNSEKDPENVRLEKEESEEIISETIKERLVIEQPSEMPQIEKPKLSRFKQQSYPGLMTPVDTTKPEKKKQSRFKQEILNQKSLTVNSVEEKVKPEVVEVESKFKKSLQSLNPKSKSKIGSVIRIPVDSTSGNEVEEKSEAEEEKEKVEKLEKEIDTIERQELDPEDEEFEVLEATLDYQSLQDDMDGMAKAYILGLYDDDIATEGEVIDKLEDFEKINKIIEMREAASAKESTGNKKLQNKASSKIEDEESNQDNDLDYFEDDLDEVASEIDDDEDSKILVDRIVEREIAEEEEAEENDLKSIDAPLYLSDNDDLSLTQNVLSQQVNLQYNTLRNKLILNQNHFKKSDEESEFEPIDEEGNPIKMSRFKAARLVHKKDL